MRSSSQSSASSQDPDCAPMSAAKSRSSARLITRAVSRVSRPLKSRSSTRPCTERSSSSRNHSTAALDTGMQSTQACTPRREASGEPELDGTVLLHATTTNPATSNPTMLMKFRITVGQYNLSTRSLHTAWAHQGRRNEPAARATFDSARVLLESFAQENPADHRVHVGLGYAYAGLGRRARRRDTWPPRGATFTT